MYEPGNNDAAHSALAPYVSFDFELCVRFDRVQWTPVYVRCSPNVSIMRILSSQIRPRFGSAYFFLGGFSMICLCRCCWCWTAIGHYSIAGRVGENPQLNWKITWQIECRVKNIVRHREYSEFVSLYAFRFCV